MEFICKFCRNKFVDTLYNKKRIYCSRDCSSKARIGKSFVDSAWNKGKPLTEEHKKNLRKAWKHENHKLSNETIEKKSNSAKAMMAERMKNPDENYRVRNLYKTVKNPCKKGKDSPVWKGGYQNKLWHNSQRRIKRLGNGGSHTLGEWEALKAQYNWTCPCCGRSEPEITISRDHIIPVSKGGSDNIENIQPLCRGCNSSKRTKTIKYEIIPI